MNVASIQDGLKLNRDLHAEVVARWKAYRSDPEEGKFWPLVSFAIKALKTHKCIIALEDQGLGQDVANLGRAFTRPRYALKEIADALNEKYPHVPGTPRNQSTVSRQKGTNPCPPRAEQMLKPRRGPFNGTEQSCAILIEQEDGLTSRASLRMRRLAGPQHKRDYDMLTMTVDE